jgi:SAM-dependent methyltransferase
MARRMGVDLRLEFDPEREHRELQEYLGDAFDETALRQSRRRLEDEWAQYGGDEDAFYHRSEGYLYELTAFAMTGTKLPYLEHLIERVAPGARILDYGCGIGSDGLMLLAAGYRVEFADFDNPSTAYLRWRLERRGLEAPVHRLDGAVPGEFDAAFAFDVIEHVRDPWALLREMEARAAMVEVNLLEFEPHEQGSHYRLPIAAILRYVSGQQLELYRILYGSSHLVIYRPARAQLPVRTRNRVRVAAEFARERFSGRWP